MKKMFFLVFALVVMSWGQAFADYYFTYTDPDGASLSGLLYTTGDDVTGGYVNDAPGGVAAILPGAGSDGYFRWDNKLYPISTPQLSDGGLVFKNASYEINIWFDSGVTGYSYYVGDLVNGGYLIAHDDNGTFNTSAVPIPRRCC